MMNSKNRSLNVFLCHASSDKTKVQQMYWRLRREGINAWLDKANLIAGQNWKIEIPKAVRNSDVVIVCLSSSSVNKEGFVQKEIRIALDVAEEKPEGTIFIIPARLEDCNVPEQISQFQWVDLFSSNGYEKLLKALEHRARTIGVMFSSQEQDHREEENSQHEFRKRAEAYRLNRQFVHAINTATKVLEINPNDAFALRTRADSYGSSGQYADAIRDASRALEIDPNNASALRTRAESYHCIRQYTDAIRDSSRALEIEPSNAFALRTRAASYGGSGQYTNAIRDSSRALEIEPNIAFAWQTRAESHRCIRQYADAIRDSSCALKIEPNNAFALRTRAESYRRIGRYTEAIRDASRALEIESYNTFARQILDKATRKQRS